MELVTIETVGKFGPKINGKWYGLKRPLKPTDFVNGAVYEVETEEWESNGKTGVNIVSKKRIETQSIQKELTRATALDDKRLNLTYDEQKSRRILRQGMVQAVVESPALAGLPFTNSREIVALVKEIATDLINFVENE